MSTKPPHSDKKPAANEASAAVIALIMTLKTYEERAASTSESEKSRADNRQLAKELRETLYKAMTPPPSVQPPQIIPSAAILTLEDSPDMQAILKMQPGPSKAYLVGAFAKNNFRSFSLETLLKNLVECEGLLEKEKIEENQKIYLQSITNLRKATLSRLKGMASNLVKPEHLELAFKLSGTRLQESNSSSSREAIVGALFNKNPDIFYGTKPYFGRAVVNAAKGLLGGIAGFVTAAIGIGFGGPKALLYAGVVPFRGMWYGATVGAKRGVLAGIRAAFVVGAQFRPDDMKDLKDAFYTSEARKKHQQAQAEAALKAKVVTPAPTIPPPAAKDRSQDMELSTISSRKPFLPSTGTSASPTNQAQVERQKPSSTDKPTKPAPDSGNPGVDPHKRDKRSHRSRRGR